MVGQKRTGDYGERIARKFLSEKGYTLLATNYRNRLGEIDIVARDGEVIVFVEVKTRTGASVETALEAVDQRKQQKISRVALSFLHHRQWYDVAARFDVLGIILNRNNHHQIHHVIDAFDYLP